MGIYQQETSLLTLSTARVSSRKYFIPGCVGRGLDLDLRIRPAPPAPAASGNPSGWAQAGPKWVGPRRAQVGGPTPGPSGWAQAGPMWVGPSRAHVGGPMLGPSGWAQAGPKPKIWDPKESKKLKFSKSKSVLPKMSARSGLVGKNLPGPIWAHLGHFLRRPEKTQKLN